MARTIAYLLIALLVILAVGWALHRRHNTPTRRYERRSRREQSSYDRVMRDKDPEGSDEG